MKPVLLPKLSENIKTAILVEWLVKEGDRFNKGDTLAIIETEKAAFELEAEESGIVQKLAYSNGDKIDINKPLAYYIESSETEEKKPESEQQESKDNLHKKNFSDILKRILFAKK